MRQLLSSGHWSFCLQLHPFRDLVLLLLKDFIVMAVNDVAYVRHATAAYFHVVLEKNSMSRLNEIK